MVEQQPSKLNTRVRFPSPAPMIPPDAAKPPKSVRAAVASSGCIGCGSNSAAKRLMSAADLNRTPARKLSAMSCSPPVSAASANSSSRRAPSYSRSSWRCAGRQTTPAVALARRHSNELDRLKPGEQALFPNVRSIQHVIPSERTTVVSRDTELFSRPGNPLALCH